jgi:hypothetical protein
MRMVEFSSVVVAQNGVSSPLKDTQHGGNQSWGKYLLLWKCSRLNKSVMSFNDDDKDKNVVSSFFHRF